MPKDLARRSEQIEVRIKDTTVSLNTLSLSNSGQILRAALDGFMTKNVLLNFSQSRSRLIVFWIPLSVTNTQNKESLEKLREKKILHYSSITVLFPRDMRIWATIRRVVFALVPEAKKGRSAQML